MNILHKDFNFCFFEDEGYHYIIVVCWGGPMGSFAYETLICLTEYETRLYKENELSWLKDFCKAIISESKIDFDINKEAFSIHPRHVKSKVFMEASEALKYKAK